MIVQQSNRFQRDRDQKIRRHVKCYVLSETDSRLWREGREPVKQVVLMLLEARAETGSCLSTPP